MQSVASQHDTMDPRWDEVRQSLPAVVAWLSAVCDLLGIDVRDTMMRDGQEASRVRPTSAHDEFENVTKPSRRCSHRTIRNNLRASVEDVSLEADQRSRRQDVFEQFKACQSELTDRQWQVIAFIYRDGITQAEIASRLGRSRSSISGHHTRALRVLADYQKRLRNERFELSRKHLNPPE